MILGPYNNTHSSCYPILATPAPNRATVAHRQTPQRASAALLPRPHQNSPHCGPKQPTVALHGAVRPEISFRDYFYVFLTCSHVVPSLIARPQRLWEGSPTSARTCFFALFSSPRAPSSFKAVNRWPSSTSKALSFCTRFHLCGLPLVVALIAASNSRIRF
jgi:hypothetical protein